jgi:hypothetical protein
MFSFHEYLTVLLKDDRIKNIIMQPLVLYQVLDVFWLKRIVPIAILIGTSFKITYTSRKLNQQIP